MQDLPLVHIVQIHWSPPPVHILKLKFDGCSLGNPSPSGIGGLIRDFTCTCLQAFSGPIGIGDVILAEIRAIVVGLKMAHSLGFHHLIVEGDFSHGHWLDEVWDLGSWRPIHHINEAPSLAFALNSLF